jgi:hypothetical protein
MPVLNGNGRRQWYSNLHVACGKADTYRHPFGSTPCGFSQPVQACVPTVLPKEFLEPHIIIRS